MLRFSFSIFFIKQELSLIMSNNVYKVLLVVAAGVGLFYYARYSNFDFKSLFNGKCDCHTGCTVEAKPVTVTPVTHEVAPHEVTPVAAEHAAVTHEAIK